MFLGLSTNLIRIHEVLAPHQEMSSLQQSSSPSALICSSLGRRKILDEHLTDSKHLVKSMLFVLPVSFWKTSDVSGCPTHAWFPQDETCTSPKKHTFSKPMVSKPMVASPFLGVKTWQGVFQPYGFPLGPWLAGVRRAVCGWNDDAGGSSLVSDGCLDGLNGCTHIGSMVLVYIYIYAYMLTWLGYIDGIHVSIYAKWLGYIDGIHVSIYTSTMDPSWGIIFAIIGSHCLNPFLKMHSSVILWPANILG